MNIKSTAGSIALALSFGAAAQAELVAYEGFESYSPAANVVGQTGGSDWTAPWSSNAASGTIDVVSQSLSAGGVNGGNHALRLENINGGSNAGRAVSRTFTRQTGPVYVSFLLRAQSLSGNEFVNVYLSDDPIATGDANEMYGAGLFINQPGLPFFVRSGSSASGNTSITSVKSTDPVQTFLVVLKVTKTQSQFYQQADLWLFGENIVAPLIEPAALATANKAANPNGLDHISIRILNIAENETLLLDEFRIGTTWNTVVVPEPTTLGLLAPLALVLVRRRRSATA